MEDSHIVNDALISKARVETTVELRLKKLAEYNQIKFSDALEFGLRFKLAERDLIDFYPENKLLINIRKLQEQLEIANNKIAELELQQIKESPKDHE